MAELANQEKLDQKIQTHLSIQTKKIHPSDLLHFSESNPQETRIFLETKQTQELDLNLRLSLGGYHCETSKDKALMRSSLVIGLVTLNRDSKSDFSVMPKGFLSLSRSCSLPIEAEHEFQMKKRVLTEGINRYDAGRGFDVSGFNGVPRRSTRFQGHDRDLMASQGPRTPLTSSSSSSSAEATATSNGNDSPFLLTNGQTHSEKPPTPGSQYPASKRARLAPKESGRGDGSMDAMMRRMPSVTTTGDGPNGRRIEGFLYKYMKGQVSIVCVCHGSFLTPAEFVRHAGGKNVSNPMKRISVFPNMLSS